MTPVRNFAMFLFSSSLLLFGCEETSSTATEDAPAENEVVWTTLFDGTNLDSWRNYRQDTISDAWKIEEGVLVMSGPGAGDIVTKDEYESFELELEWKISEAGNSGIFFHVAEADSLGAVYATGPEMQILDDERHPDGKLLTRRSGANYDMQPCAVVTVKPVGEWNKVRLIVNNGHVEHWLNDQKVVDYVLGSPEWQAELAKSKFADWSAYGRAGKGHIALQDHGDLVWFRNIRVRTL
ncbi:MAG: DUF1080 domain-containing protein [Bacteroidia bacterium]|nr:DUF1080 domain-containing protein [Bacteroidia bacterium]